MLGAPDAKVIGAKSVKTAAWYCSNRKFKILCAV